MLRDEGCALSIPAQGQYQQLCLPEVPAPRLAVLCKLGVHTSISSMLLCLINWLSVLCLLRGDITTPACQHALRPGLQAEALLPLRAAPGAGRGGAARLRAVQAQQAAAGEGLAGEAAPGLQQSSSALQWEVQGRAQECRWHWQAGFQDARCEVITSLA